MINIIIQKFKEQFMASIYYLIGLVAYVWMMIWAFPIFSGLKDTVVKQYPPQLLKFFGTDSAAGLSTIQGFLALEFLSLFFILIVGFYIGSSAGSIIAGSIEKKTIDFDLSQPISRTKYLIAGAVPSLINTFLLTALTSLSIILFCAIYKINISHQGVFAFVVTATFFLWSIFAIAIFLSSILKTKLSVASGTILIAMAFYIFTAMTKIVDRLSKYDKFSLFHLYDPQKLLDTGHINWSQILVMVIILIVGLSSSLIIFNKKDL
jgi:ABC-2 type transport system permease protein